MPVRPLYLEGQTVRSARQLPSTIEFGQSFVDQTKAEVNPGCFDLPLIDAEPELHVQLPCAG